jgi:hypothetical protein
MPTYMYGTRQTRTKEQAYFAHLLAQRESFSWSELTMSPGERAARGMGIPPGSASNPGAAKSNGEPVATVLVTDDNRDMVEMTASLLRMANYKVICTYSVEQAFEMLDE